MTDSIFKSIYNFLKSLFNEPVDNCTELRIDYFEDGILVPTQKDKPSPHSSLSQEVAIKLLSKHFKSPTYTIHTIANTNSMEPLIDDNCIILMESTEGKQLLLGDIVTWYHKQTGKYILHRIIELSSSGKSFKIKGDNNFTADGWIPVSLINNRLVCIFYCESKRQGD